MRLLGLDVGDVRIGVAVCDSLEIAAFPVGVVKRVGSLKRDVAAVAALATEQEAEGIVVGLPLSLDGEVRAAGAKDAGIRPRPGECPSRAGRAYGMKACPAWKRKNFSSVRAFPAPNAAKR